MIDISNAGEHTLNSLSSINILLGKNGSGKSTLLRRVEENLSGRNDEFGKTKYLTPERGGSLVYEAGIEQNLVTNQNWLPGQRRRNQAPQFRQQSTAQFRRLKELVLEEIEQDQTRRQDNQYNFDVYVDKINTLLDQIEIRRHDSTFKIYQKGNDTEIPADAISSGESELISLGIECLIFSKELEDDKHNLLFLDEPDVHLHPDLQVRLMHFIKDLVEEERDGFIVLIATHSTAILGALESYTNTQIAFIKNRQHEVQFEPISGVLKKILPVFGAHPLSNLFNQAPVLLVEGEDDERIWQQAVRTSNGGISVYPCACDGIDNLNDFENEVRRITSSVYDDAKAFSLRDRDGSNNEIEDIDPIIRFKLGCRNAENLILTDEVLQSLGTTWEELQQKIARWIEANPSHEHLVTTQQFRDDGYDRKNFDLKEIRNDLMHIIGSAKPWEVAVGQVIGSLTRNDDINFSADGSIYNFLGEKLVRELVPLDG